MKLTSKWLHHERLPASLFAILVTLATSRKGATANTILLSVTCTHDCGSTSAIFIVEYPTLAFAPTFGTAGLLVALISACDKPIQIDRGTMTYPSCVAVPVKPVSSPWQHANDLLQIGDFTLPKLATVDIYATLTSRRVGFELPTDP